MSRTVYVCYINYGYDGDGPPECVFEYETDAEAWVAKENKGAKWSTAKYVELEIK